jgi:hypothetical protein
VIPYIKYDPAKSDPLTLQRASALGRIIQPGTSVRVVAGKRRDWLEQLASFSNWPHLPEVDCVVTAVILRVHHGE